VFVAITPRLRAIPIADLLQGCGLGAGIAVALGYLVIATVPLNLFQLVVGVTQGEGSGLALELGKLLLICVVLLVPFLLAGIVLARIFATETDRIGRLYAADLAGAGLACALCIPLMTLVSPPGTVSLAGAAFVLAALPSAAERGAGWLGAVLGAVVLVLAGALMPQRLPDPVPDRFKARTGKPEESRWSPVFRVDVLPEFSAYPSRFLLHDGLVGSSILRFDGDLSGLKAFETSDRSYPFRLLAPGPKVAIIGSAGGHEILVSLYFGASHVTGVELNPVTVDLLRNRFADYSGQIAHHPKVTLLNAEGRSFLESSPERYDLVWFVAPDSYAAMNAASSGAFVLVESYLYTVEMVETALAHLDPGGILCAQFGEIDFDGRPNRTTRYVATAREALRRRGVTDPARHVLVASMPSFATTRATTVMVRSTPFSAEEVARVERATAAIPGGRLEFAWTLAANGQPFDVVLTASDAELAVWYRRHRFLVGPIEDDSPFFWHFMSFRDAIFGTHGNVEEGYGERVLVLLIAVGAVLGAVFLFLPLLAIRATWRTIPHKTSTAIYFAALGLGFMFIEVSLIQRLTLFLGYPTHSLTVTLFALLWSTGVGSLLSERVMGAWRGALVGYGAALLLLVVFYETSLTPIVHAAIGWPFGVRVAATVLLLAPLGLCLGAFMPLGLHAVAGTTVHRETFVAWAWAVNGFCSVVSSVVATMLSMTLGFDGVMACGAGLYVLGIAALLRLGPAVVVGKETR
jgi:spermidine synthase